MPSNDTAPHPAIDTTAHTRPRDGAWGEFVRLHGPAVYAAGRRSGLGDADAAELVGEVLRFFAGGVDATRHYPAPETLRMWVRSVTREKLRDFSAVRRTPRMSASAADRDDDWERDDRRRLTASAMESVRHEYADNAWEAFWGTAVEGDSPERVADRLATSVGAVWVARCRVLARLSEVVEGLRVDSVCGA